MLTHTLDITKHATTRMQQRGVKDTIMDLLFEHADCWEDAGGGCERVYLSKRQGQRLVKAKIITADILFRLKRLCLIINDNTIITTFHKTHRARRYN